MANRVDMLPCVLKLLMEVRHIYSQGEPFIRLSNCVVGDRYKFATKPAEDRSRMTNGFWLARILHTE